MRRGLPLLAAAVVACAGNARAQDAFDVPPPPSVRAAEPSPDAQKESLKLVRELYKEDYARRTPGDLAALSAKLLRQALETKDDPAGRFVLLGEARDLAAQAGDAAGAAAAADALAKDFAVDGLALKAEALAAAGRGARTPDAAAALADAWLGFFDDAVAAERFDALSGLAAKAEAAAKAAQDPPLAARVQARNREIADFSREFQRMNAALKTLEAKPDDPAARLAIGRYQFLVRGDWDAAAPELARGSDALLKVAAERELEKPADGAAKAAAGDAWFEAAEKEKNAGVKTRLVARARHWYDAALPGLSGLAKARVEKRLQELDAGDAAAGRAVNLLRLIDPAKDAVRGGWRLENGALLTPPGPNTMLQVPYELPDEYVLDFVAERQGRPECLYLALAVAGRPFGFEIDGWGGDATILLRMDGRGGKDPNETLHRGTLFAAGKPSAIRVTVRKTRITLAFDGKTIVDWKADPNRVAMNWPVPNPRAPGVGTWNVVYRISKLTLTPISGAGKKLR